MNAYLYDCEWFCEDCVGDDYYECWPNGGGESDIPEMCSGCGIPFGNSLTSEGIQYVLEAIQETLKESEEDRNRIMPLQGTAEETMTYWYGSRHVEILRNWATQLLDYVLLPQDEKLVLWFLERTDVNSVIPFSEVFED